MISQIHIQNFKSISDLKFKPGQITVIIGENGSGKSNILEAITFASRAASNKLDNDTLFARGVRVTGDAWMKSAFPEEAHPDKQETKEREIKFAITGDATDEIFECSVRTKRREDDGSFNGWEVSASVWEAEIAKALQEKAFVEEIESTLKDMMKTTPALVNLINKNPSIRAAFHHGFGKAKLLTAKGKRLSENAVKLGLDDFIIYAPENTTLRTPPSESAIQPLGTKGEGLFKLLQSFKDPKFSDRLIEIKSRLRVFGWFEDFIEPDDISTIESKLHIRDRWLDSNKCLFDQRSANEGFLYLLFYFTLLMSWRTPKFFAIDNLDNALNPRLCSELMMQVVDLAKKYNKQVICTTHNPAILDGLDLADDKQRLFAVKRDSEGRTIIRRIFAPEHTDTEIPVRLSEAFSRGIIGGVPEHF